MNILTTQIDTFARSTAPSSDDTPRDQLLARLAPLRALAQENGLDEVNAHLSSALRLLGGTEPVMVFRSKRSKQTTPSAGVKRRFTPMLSPPPTTEASVYAYTNVVDEFQFTFEPPKKKARLYRPNPEAPLGVLIS